ncbi:medium-chain acyl-CoA ligase ACSF2, mitochondrial-like isoform X1 [Schistocerca cancellata]|uniref:medium-chain acyl-CoA ligase ACSF2, mitochondrial-like isoform X1 n=1 Tax=Schistocerca cancellata TaxID=274614 RepID=UPI0021186725|nr:medium-chain acyl-CoA ligase ACSF2, mitochondrial-like isoform X1 [Schistocerca cancellata]
MVLWRRFVIVLGSRAAARQYSSGSKGPKLSYWHEASEIPLVNLTVGQLVDKSAQLWGDREAIVSVHQGHRLTFQEVKEKVDKLAAGFLEIGLKHGDALAVWAPNLTEWYLTSLAANKAGLVIVNINPAYQIPELEYCLKKVHVRALVAAETFKTQKYPEMVQALAPEVTAAKPGHLKSLNLPNLTTVIVIGDKQYPGMFRFSDVMDCASTASFEKLKQLDYDIQADEGCNVQFTSGTTGHPKATLLSHHSVVNNSYFLGERAGLYKKHHRICLQVPFFHCFGNVCGVLNSLHHGCTIVLPSAGFKGEDSAKAILKEKCSIVYGTPTMNIDLLNFVESSGLKINSLEILASGGAISSPDLYEKLTRTFGLERVTTFYGMTETAPLSFIPEENDPPEKTYTTVGRVIDHVEVKVVDETGKMVPLGTTGELWVRGYCNMLGYWGDKKHTEETIREDRWLRTGDAFILEENGYGKIVGRIKDMIIRGGENIFPKEIEILLETHPSVSEAQVFGIADDRLGEQVCVAISTKKGHKLTEQDVKDFCRGKIAHFKIPHYIRFVEEFPKTVSGKIQKFKLRKMLEKELGKETQ